LARYADLFPWIRSVVELPARYNVAPTTDVAVMLNNGSRAITAARWGLVPSWAKDVSVGSRMINARSETIFEKPAFRSAIRGRRCVVFADGFYEWAGAMGKKQPMYIRRRDDRPLLLAGVWEAWRDGEGATLRTCTIITRAASELMQPVHDRMPVVVEEDSVEGWLESKEREAVEDFFRAGAGVELVMHAVGRQVNSVGNDVPGLILPLVDSTDSTGSTLGSKGKDTGPGLFD
jgi:putative SOS response-associated peptidase YedK